MGFKMKTNELVMKNTDKKNQIYNNSNSQITQRIEREPYKTNQISQTNRSLTLYLSKHSHTAYY